MKTKLRIMLTLLLCTALFLCLSSEAFADTVASGTCGENVNWSLDEEGTLTISGSGAMEDYTSASAVPWGAEDIYAVTVEEGVTHVGGYAFSGLFLDNVLLPESLESIGDNAFSSAAVTEAHFAGNLKQWEKDIVIGSGNDALDDVIVCDKDVTYQGEGFSLANGVVTSTVSTLPSDFKREYNDYIFEVVFDGVTEIGYSACGGDDNDSLTSLTSVTIPDGVTSIGVYAFRDCSSLMSVTIPDSVTSIGHRAFYECSGLTSVTIPDGVTSIGDRVFYGCSGLTSVTIPDSVTSIGNYVFSGCSGLTSVTFGNSLTSIGRYAFYRSGLTSVTIPDSVTSIGKNAFEDCSSLMSVTLGNSLTSIEDHVFSGCSSLTSVTIPYGVTSIGQSMFHSCSSLTNVTIPDSVTSIGGFAFFRCTYLTSVTIPGSVTTIGERAFEGCFYLYNVYYTGTAAMWDAITIGSSNDGLNRATIHYAMNAGETGDCRWSLSESGTLQISGSGRMADCSEGTAPWYAYREQITAIDIKDTVTYLGSYAFSGLENAAAVSGMNGVTSIGEGAFKDCAALPAFTLPAAVTSMVVSKILCKVQTVM